MIPEKTARIGYLDSVRGLASLMVVLYHFIGWHFQDRPRLFHGLSIVFNGSDAVSLFFVLSGLVLTYPFFRQEKSQPLQIHYPKFAFARIFRLYPAFLATLLAYTVWMHRHEWDLGLLYGVFIKNNYGFWEEAVMYRNSFPLVGQAWTLAVEMTVSLLVPLFALFLWQNPRHFPYFMIAWVPMGIFFSQFGLHFMLGMLLSYHFETIRDYDIRQAKWYPYRYWLYGLVGVLFSSRHLFELKAPGPTFFYFTNIFLGINAFTYSGIASFLILAKIINSSRIQRWLAVRPLLFLGKISYGMYLLHWGLLYYWLQGHKPWFYAIAGQHAMLAGGLILLSLLGTSLFFSTLLYYFWEKPFIQIGKQLAARIWNR
jgi:peptidoglycan/LPS O-acetylase OafA/YrhL